MNQLHRFYVPDLCTQRESVRLPEEELHHALHVVRLRAGDRIGLFDGAGAYADAKVVEAGRRDLVIEKGAVHRESEAAGRLTLAQAWLNHAHAVETVIRRGTELGVDEFVFFRAEHSDKTPSVSEKWTRMAVESCKQCGRNRLPAFHAAKTLDEVLETRPARIIVATQAVESRPVREIVGDAEKVTLMVGPEGDFTPRELDAVWAAGGHALSLGPLTLRAEVAAIAAIAIIQYYLGRLGPS
jgi:16S rRNA (uracil1498-N3)-methyltransferase